MGDIMYVKNINQLFKEQIPIKLRLSEGNSIYGKIISQDGKNALIQLYDGTIIPSIFLSENNIVTDRFLKFVIEQFSEEGLILRIIDDAQNLQGEDSINSLLSRLNIPRSEGTKIINSLIKFNLPATDENIMAIYKNITFIDNLSKMKDNDILSFLHNYIEGDFTHGSEEFNITKDIITNLAKLDTDFLSLLTENDVPYSIDNMLKTSNFLENKFSINNIINTLKNLLDLNNNNTATNSFNDILKELINTPENIPLLHDYIEGKLFPGEGKYIRADMTFNKFANQNSNYLSDLIKSELPNVLKNLTEASNMQNIVTMDSIINELGEMLKENSTELFSFSFKDIIKELYELKEHPELLSSPGNYQEGKEAIEGNGSELIQKGFSRYLDKSTNYLSSLLEKNLPEMLARVTRGSEIPKDSIGSDKIILALKNVLENEKKDSSLISFNNTIKEIQDKPEILNLLPKGLLNKFTDSVDILKHLSNNYNIYYFNSYNQDKLFKNNIIIKNKYRANSSINPDDVKVFITVDTPNIGVVESYLYKKGSSLTVSIKTEDKFIKLFKKSIEVLNDSLKNKGYSVIDISISTINPDTNLVTLSNFFNDTIFKELDVRV